MSSTPKLQVEAQVLSVLLKPDGYTVRLETGAPGNAFDLSFHDGDGLKFKPGMRLNLEFYPKKPQ